MKLKREREEMVYESEKECERVKGSTCCAIDDAVVGAPTDLHNLCSDHTSVRIETRERLKERERGKEREFSMVTKMEEIKT